MNSKGDFWCKNGNVREYEIKKLRYFIRSWDPHFLGNVKKLNQCFKQIHSDIKELKNKSIDQIDLENEKTKRCIEKIFNLAARCGKKNRSERTDASKIIHTILPELFVMWDKEIRNRIWRKQKKDGWKKPKNDKFTGTEYAYCFLPLMQNEAKAVIKSYIKKHHGSPKKAINGIKKEGHNYTLAKLLDEYNYVKYTLPKKKDT
ncbi:MAG: hypothetical protein KAW02_06430 [candidate division Zixibacteria bacterium]|nr:hypothetical protein [candidate division Zixibacteria bacterium]